MSLLAPRPQEMDRASVILPTVTCSSCAAAIPLSSLGDHVCRPSSHATSSRGTPRPSQIVIPSPKSGVRRPDPHPAPRPQYAGSNSSSSRSSPASFPMPLRPSAPNLSPLDIPAPGCSRSPSPRTPSPTNPFFPHPDQQNAVVHGLGLGGVSRPEGPFPTDAPLPDSTILYAPSSGGAGMAGVGRRAFAAAAWGVRAGVALAASGRPEPVSSRDRSLPPPQSQPHPQPNPLPQPHAHSRSTSAQTPTLPPWHKTRNEASPREPMQPKFPLSSRQRSGTVSNSSAQQPPPRSGPLPVSPPQRSFSAMDRAQFVAPSPPRQRSASALAQRAFPEARRKDSGLMASGGPDDRTASHSQAQTVDNRNNTKLPFFERYKQMTATTTGSITPKMNSPAVGSIAAGMFMNRRSDEEEELVASPIQTVFALDDDYEDGQGSALPWATPILAESPVIKQGQTVHTEMRAHQRHQTSESGASSNSSASSSQSSRYGLVSGPESEEVVTPSHSWGEGLAERAGGTSVRNRTEEGKGGLGFELVLENLEQIGEEEEDEGERVVFGAISSPPRRASEDVPRMKSSSSSSKINAHDSHSRSRTAPETKRSIASERRSKTCQKCGDAVGGAKRFVERDGVVLCERDWKKLYLPSCRRCNLPIEKSAVSSSDGQLKGKWHRGCFTCTRCDRPFEGDSFYVHAGRPWCQHHYHEENGTLCALASCRQPIEGACILTPNPNSQRFHPGHLRCDHRGGVSGAQTCRETMEEYYDVAGGRYCERHVGEALRKTGGDGRGDRNIRVEKRRTRLVSVHAGGF